MTNKDKDLWISRLRQEATKDVEYIGKLEEKVESLSDANGVLQEKLDAFKLILEEGE